MVHLKKNIGEMLLCNLSLLVLGAKQQHCQDVFLLASIITLKSHSKYMVLPNVEQLEGLVQEMIKQRSAFWLELRDHFCGTGSGLDVLGIQKK